MDSKDVNKQIRRKIKPILKQVGFDKSTSRSFWRHRDDKVNVITFESFNSYEALTMKCTTFSFAIRLGIYFECIPEHKKYVSVKDGFVLPHEAGCHLRRTLQKSIKQKHSKGGLVPHDEDYFYVNADGSDLDVLIDDARTQIESEALPWFDKYDDMEVFLHTLLEERENMQGTWGMGNIPSPKRSYYTGFIARELGKWQIAKRAFDYVIESNCMKDSNVDDAYAEVVKML